MKKKHNKIESLELQICNLKDEQQSLNNEIAIMTDYNIKLSDDYSALEEEKNKIIINNKYLSAVYHIFGLMEQAAKGTEIERFITEATSQFRETMARGMLGFTINGRTLFYQEEDNEKKDEKSNSN